VKSPVENILAYVDGTEQSVTAAQLAICFAKLLGAHLTVVYVVNTRALDELLKAKIFLAEEEVEYARDLEADAQRYLDHVAQLCRQKGVAAETLKLTGSVHQQIVDTVKQKNIDLLFIGELARIRSRRDEFYDEAERAMRSVGCSVLIVKNDTRVWEIFDALA
jgi:nucleotide-binding universal stress UspA family protein